MAKAIVSKFGGTSMGDAECMLRSARLTARQDACIVVVSATSGTTNDLIALGRLAQSSAWSEAEAMLAKISDRHRGIAKNLKAGEKTLASLEALISEMTSIARGVHYLKDCSLKAMDTLMSLGERMSSVLFVEAMAVALRDKRSARKAELLDVRDVLKTDDQFSKARPQTEKIIELCTSRLAPAKQGDVVYVTQGFVGATDEGHTTTLGRGGSDYSAAILAEGIGADVLEIWTDVPGIATTDPRLCPKASVIPEISFKETSELATFGAKVLHPATLLPAVRRNIPVFVGSSFDPDQGGTWVRREVTEHPLIRAMALRRKQALVTLTTPEMLQAHGFLFRIFKVFNDHQVSIDAITTSEISVSMTFDEAALSNKKLLQDLSQVAEVQSEENLCLVSLIGNNINHTPGLARKIFDAIPDINVRMICLGASKHNFCFLVSEDKGPETLQRLHHAFVEMNAERRDS